VTPLTARTIDIAGRHEWVNVTTAKSFASLRTVANSLVLRRGISAPGPFDLSEIAPAASSPRREGYVGLGDDANLG